MVHTKSAFSCERCMHTSLDCGFGFLHMIRVNPSIEDVNLTVVFFSDSACAIERNPLLFLPSTLFFSTKNSRKWTRWMGIGQEQGTARETPEKTFGALTYLETGLDVLVRSYSITNYRETKNRLGKLFIIKHLNLQT